VLSVEDKHDIDRMGVEAYREMLEIEIYETHKDAHGTKGYHYKFEDMSLEELIAEANELARIADHVREQEKFFAEWALQSFEHRVAITIADGAGDRLTALRWMTQMHTWFGLQDVEHYVWGLGFLFTPEGRELVDELCYVVEFTDEPEVCESPFLKEAQ
jgi:hypothetical protein